MSNNTGKMKSKRENNRDMKKKVRENVKRTEKK